MNPFCENEKSPTNPRSHVIVPIIRHRQEILEATRIDDGFENDVDTCTKPNSRVQSGPICLHQHLNKENAHRRESAVERLHWGRSSSTRAIFGTPPPPMQPRSPRKMRQRLSSVSVKEKRKDSGAGEAHQRGSPVFERRQQSDSKQNSGSGALTDQPALLPVSRHEMSEARCVSTNEDHKEPTVEESQPESSFRSLQQCGASLSPDYRESFDMAHPSQALARRRRIVEPSTVKAVKESLNDAVEMKNRATLLETKRRCRQLSGTPRRSSVFRFTRSSSFSSRYKRLADREALSSRYKRVTDL
jgi:hypothetical protein